MWPFSHAAPDTPKPDDRIHNRDILADDSVMRARRRWTRLLIIYLRGLALLCLVRGMVDWSNILGFIGPEDGFETAPVIWQVSVVLYAILNCVAAVGLWLTSAWGAVLWLIVTLCEVFLPWTLAKGVRDAATGDIVLLGLVLVYVLLTWLSAREREREH
jgi:cobalamin biosynthesis protein CobD/CbiB